MDIRFKLKFPASNTYTINKSSVKNLIDSLHATKLIDVSSIKLSDIKDIPGIIKSEQKALINQNLVKKTYRLALNKLLENRGIEGQKIKKHIFLKNSKNSKEFKKAFRV